MKHETYMEYGICIFIQYITYIKGSKLKHMLQRRCFCPKNVDSPTNNDKKYIQKPGSGHCTASFNRSVGKRNMFVFQPVDIFALSSNRSHCSTGELV
jgi:hypothetical protein